MMAHGDDLQFAVFFGFLGVLLVAEWRWPFRKPAARGRWLANYGLTALNVLALGLLPTSFVAAAAVAESKEVGLLHAVALPLPLFIGVNLLLRGLISFVTHLLLHKVPLLWRVHRVHHLDTELDVSTTVRFHPLEFPIGLAVGLPFVIALGLSPWLLATYEVLDAAITVWSHANVSLPPRLERIVRLLVVTPDLHRLHHSTVPEETDSNFSAVFPVWDALFGTYRVDTRARSSGRALGLEEARGAETRSLPWLLAVPFRSIGPPAEAVPPAAQIL
jgi:sterol desaturase/sphingolipid hydroxylase (fatty acid hydroxylase superfamily)